MTPWETLTRAQYHAHMARSIDEAALQAQVLRIAGHTGWRAYHTHDSRRSAAGFPDLVLAHPRAGRVVFAELKSEAGRLSRAQLAWLTDLAAAGAHTHVWRPADLLDGTITTTLASPTTGT
jgi:hypothetical protein